MSEQTALELAEAFSANESKRKAPNERTSDESFLAISNRGAEALAGTLADLGAE